MLNRPLIFALMLVLSSIQAQIHQQAPNFSMPSYLTEDSTIDWMEFTSNSPFKTQNANFKALEQALRLQEHEHFYVQKQETDVLGWKHYRLQHQYKGLNVIGSEFIVHEFGGEFKKANGKLIQDLEVDIVPTLPQEQALQAIFDSLKAQKYAWEDAHYEKIIKTLQEDDKATFCPKGKLVIASPNFERTPDHYRLAWEFDIFSIEPLQRFRIFVDAQDGSIVTSFSRIQHGDVPSTGVTNYSGSVDFHAESYGTNNYRLHNSIFGDGIETYNANELHSYPYIDFVNNNTNWNGNNTRTAIDAHWGTEQVYRYFLDSHNHNSYDGNASKLMSWVHYAKDYVNAFWNGQWMTYGNGNGTTYNSLTSLDIIGHEISHGIIENTANLVYRYEPGALNESFADIFGVTIEFLKHPNGGNWFMGDQCHIAGNGFRSLENPNLFNHPDTYDGDYWVGQNFCTASPWNDYCGVHVNSSVQNKWYYLLVEGGTGVNDHGDTFTVEGIELEKAAAIAFRNLTVYLTSTSEFNDSRAGSLQAAIDLYGAGSNEVQQVANAWCAVGVGGCEIESSEVLTLIAPNGGEIWEQGTSKTIRWNSVGDIERVKINYSINSGASWITITNSTNNDGSYQWFLPNNPTGMGIIEIVSVDDENVKDKSDAPFTILGCTTISGFSTSTTEICEDEPILFTNNSINYETLEWQANGLTESTQEIFEKTFTEAGTYTIRLIAYGDNNCSDTHEISINVYRQPNANFHYTFEGFDYQFFAEDLEVIQYSWKIGGKTNVSSEASFAYTFTEAGNYEVCLEVMNEDCVESVEDCQIILVESEEEDDSNAPQSCWSVPDIYNTIIEQPSHSFFADFDSDGDEDMVVAHKQQENATIYINNGDGSFDNGTSISVPARVEGCTFDDWNLDGNLDFAFAHPTSFSGAAIGLISIYFGNGNGSFQPYISHNVPGSWTYYLESGNIDEDEHPDLIVTAAGSNKFFVLLNDGTGGFIVGSSYNAGSEPLEIGLGDFDSDSDIDIVIGSQRDFGRACVFFNEGDGSFGNKQTYLEGLT